MSELDTVVIVVTDDATLLVVGLTTAATNAGYAAVPDSELPATSTPLTVTVPLLRSLIVKL